jgi:hypothetical protein
MLQLFNNVTGRKHLGHDFYLFTVRECKGCDFYYVYNIGEQKLYTVYVPIYTDEQRAREMVKIANDKYRYLKVYKDADVRLSRRCPSLWEVKIHVSEDTTWTMLGNLWVAINGNPDELEEPIGDDWDEFCSLNDYEDNSWYY